MDNNDQLVLTWLEEEMLDVAKENIYSVLSIHRG